MAAASTSASAARKWLVEAFAKERTDEPLVKKTMLSYLDQSVINVEFPAVFVEWLARAGPVHVEGADIDRRERFERAVGESIDRLRVEVDLLRHTLLGERTDDEVIDSLRHLGTIIVSPLRLDPEGARVLLLSGSPDARAEAERRFVKRRLPMERVRGSFVAVASALDAMTIAWRAVAPTPNERGRGQSFNNDEVASATAQVRALLAAAGAAKVEPALAALASIAIGLEAPCTTAARFAGRRRKWQVRVSE